MMIPTKLQLGAHIWTVKHIHGMITAEDGDKCRGLCDYNTLTMSVNVDQVSSMVMHTFIHELLHAALWSLGSDLADNEGFVDGLGGFLAQAILSAQE